MHVASIPGAVFESEELPRLDWELLDTHLRADVDERDWPAACNDWIRQWLLMLRERLGAQYRVDEYKQTILLSAGTRAEAGRVLRFAEQRCDEIRRLIPEIVAENDPYLRPLVSLATIDDYYRYCAHFYPEGEFATSGGVCITRAYAHIALPATAGVSSAGVTHELTHLLIIDMDLPTWLEEGLVQEIEQLLDGSHELRFNHEELSRHRRYWTTHGIERFFSGASFRSPDEGQELSYALAHMLVHTLLRDRRAAFGAMVLDFEPEDSAAMVQKHLGVTLEQLTAHFVE